MTMRAQETAMQTDKNAIAAEFAKVLRAWWAFNDAQQHTHSWHDRENFIEKVLPELLAAALHSPPAQATPETGGVTEEMIQAACIAGYGVDTDKDSNLHKLMKRALTAALSTP